jgi:tetratricopeptide (TPR) repeat protein
LATAEANLGKPTARRRLRGLLRDMPELKPSFEALKVGRPGPGWSERFPYFSPTDFLPGQRVKEFIDLVGLGDEMAPDRYEREVAAFARRFPQLTLVAEKIIWEEMQPQPGLIILEVLGTPAAHDALRRFGLSQAGDQEDRLQALSLLAEAGQIDEAEPLRVWIEGEWQEIHLRGYEITEGPGWDHDPRAAELMTEGLMALEEDDTDRALQLLEQARELAPESKEIYNNLASAHARRKEYDQARAMYRAALEIDPLYVFPRCNLVTFLLGEDDLAGAKEMLAPLAQVKRFHPQEAAFYHYTQARVLIEEDDYDLAEKNLKLALDTWPDYEDAKELLVRLQLSQRAWESFGTFREQRDRRDRNWRLRLQEKLDSPDPSLAEALPLYTKDILTGMARVVLPWGGWSTLRKGALIEAIIEALTDAETVAELVNGRSIFRQQGLDEEQRAALALVLSQGGYMPWPEFDEAFDNDLDESRYWQYHRPETVMGQLRLRGFLVEATVDDELLIIVPVELRPLLGQALEG